MVWCYKTTKEELDRVDRYYTQFEIDRFVLGELRKSKEIKSDQELARLINDFEKYMAVKKKNVDENKFKDAAQKVLNPSYLYLRKRLAAIEKAILKFLGAPQLKRIEDLYEDEMTSRILSAREHT